MPELQSILLSALTGFISGLLLSMPVGPVNLTIINEGARRGFTSWTVPNQPASSPNCSDKASPE